MGQHCGGQCDGRPLRKACWPACAIARSGAMALRERLQGGDWRLERPAEPTCWSVENGDRGAPPGQPDRRQARSVRPPADALRASPMSASQFASLSASLLARKGEAKPSQEPVFWIEAVAAAGRSGLAASAPASRRATSGCRGFDASSGSSLCCNGGADCGVDGAGGGQGEAERGCVRVALAAAGACG
jgi:hypothetical protein